MTVRSALNDLHNPDDYSTYSVALQLAVPHLQEALRHKRWEEAHRISVRMMTCLHRLNAFASARQNEEAQQAEAAQRQEID